MASAKELFHSRVGTTVGVNGAQNATSTWEVITNAPTDNPIDALNLLAVRDGTKFRWTSTGVVAKDFFIADRKTPTYWIVVVLYGPPSVLNPTVSWRVDVSGSLETETLKFDLDGNPIGAPIYITKELYNELTPIGRLKYDDLAGYQSFNRGKVVALHRIKNASISRDFSIVGASRTKPVATMTLARRIPNCDGNIRGNSLSFLNNVNDAPFYGAPAKTLKVIGVDIRTAEGMVLGQREFGVCYDVTLAFYWNQEGHTPLKMPHLYVGEDGRETVITAISGEDVQESSFKLYNEDNLNNLLDNFEPERP